MDEVCVVLRGTISDYKRDLDRSFQDLHDIEEKYEKEKEDLSIALLSQSSSTSEFMIRNLDLESRIEKLESDKISLQKQIGLLELNVLRLKESESEKGKNLNSCMDMLIASKIHEEEIQQEMQLLISRNLSLTQENELLQTPKVVDSYVLLSTSPRRRRPIPQYDVESQTPDILEEQTPLLSTLKSVIRSFGDYYCICDSNDEEWRTDTTSWHYLD